MKLCANQKNSFGRDEDVKQFLVDFFNNKKQYSQFLGNGIYFFFSQMQDIIIKKFQKMDEL